MLLTKGVDRAMLFTQNKYSILLRYTSERKQPAVGTQRHKFPDWYPVWAQNVEMCAGKCILVKMHGPETPQPML